MTIKNGRLVLLVAVLTTIGCDRLTKHVASTSLAGTPGRSYLGDTVRLGYVENPGGFLSFGADWPPAVRTGVFTVATGVLLLALIVHGVRRRWQGWQTLGLALMVAGGLSNWIDRVARGSVVDFLNVGIGSLRTGIFNVADFAMMVGIAVFVFGVYREDERETQPTTATETP